MLLGMLCSYATGLLAVGFQAEHWLLTAQRVRHGGESWDLPYTNTLSPQTEQNELSPRKAQETETHSLAH